MRETKPLGAAPPEDAEAQHIEAVLDHSARVLQLERIAVPDDQQSRQDVAVARWLKGSITQGQ